MVLVHVFCYVQYVGVLSFYTPCVFLYLITYLNFSHTAKKKPGCSLHNHVVWKWKFDAGRGFRRKLAVGRLRLRWWLPVRSEMTRQPRWPLCTIHRLVATGGPSLECRKDGAQRPRGSGRTVERGEHPSKFGGRGWSGATTANANSSSRSADRLVADAASPSARPETGDRCNPDPANLDTQQLRFSSFRLRLHLSSMFRSTYNNNPDRKFCCGVLARPLRIFHQQ